MKVKGTMIKEIRHVCNSYCTVWYFMQYMRATDADGFTYRVHVPFSVDINDVYDFFDMDAGEIVTDEILKEYRDEIGYSMVYETSRQKTIGDVVAFCNTHIKRYNANMSRWARLPVLSLGE